jgi:hypothetical protein
MRELVPQSWERAGYRKGNRRNYQLNEDIPKLVVASTDVFYRHNGKSFEVQGFGCQKNQER